jgi:hypothetical protein
LVQQPDVAQDVIVKLREHLGCAAPLLSAEASLAVEGSANGMQEHFSLPSSGCAAEASRRHSILASVPAGTCAIVMLTIILVRFVGHFCTRYLKGVRSRLTT